MSPASRCPHNGARGVERGSRQLKVGIWELIRSGDGLWVIGSWVGLNYKETCCDEWGFGRGDRDSFNNVRAILRPFSNFSNSICVLMPTRRTITMRISDVKHNMLLRRPSTCASCLRLPRGRQFRSKEANKAGGRVRSLCSSRRFLYVLPTRSTPTRCPIMRSQCRALHPNDSSGLHRYRLGVRARQARNEHQDHG